MEAALCEARWKEGKEWMEEWRIEGWKREGEGGRESGDVIGEDEVGAHTRQRSVLFVACIVCATHHPVYALTRDLLHLLEEPICDLHDVTLLRLE